tara:strand:+ start:291 stop:536 length:246 start_codon:yes stop_codon:yes gene_type:complete
MRLISEVIAGYFFLNKSISLLQATLIGHLGFILTIVFQYSVNGFLATYQLTKCSILSHLLDLFISNHFHLTIDLASFVEVA